jgi:hypothetical protein
VQCDLPIITGNPWGNPKSPTNKSSPAPTENFLDNSQPSNLFSMLSHLAQSEDGSSDSQSQVDPSLKYICMINEDEDMSNTSSPPQPPLQIMIPPSLGLIPMQSQELASPEVRALAQFPNQMRQLVTIMARGGLQVENIMQQILAEQQNTSVVVSELKEQFACTLQNYANAPFVAWGTRVEKIIYALLQDRENILQLLSTHHTGLQEAATAFNSLGTAFNGQLSLLQYLQTNLPEMVRSIQNNHSTLTTLNDQILGSSDPEAPPALMNCFTQHVANFHRMQNEFIQFKESTKNTL